MTTHIASTDEQQIRDLLSAYEKALNTSDAEAAAAVYAGDGVFYPYNLPTAAGTEELLAPTVRSSRPSGLTSLSRSTKS